MNFRIAYSWMGWYSYYLYEYLYHRPCFAGIVVQLVRAPPCQGGSCGFESRQSRTRIRNIHPFFFSFSCKKGGRKQNLNFNNHWNDILLEWISLLFSFCIYYPDKYGCRNLIFFDYYLLIDKIYISNILILRIKSFTIFIQSFIYTIDPRHTFFFTVLDQ